ncbi:MAG: hypothetical protein IJJ69_02690 [Oscillospiraceae bacterium]|nr:hypothetical protein [Oscillospiraceae bacterium]
MKKLIRICLMCSLLLLTACNQQEENPVPAEQSAESTSAVTETKSESESETESGQEAFQNEIKDSIITQETVAEIIIPSDDIVLALETSAVNMTLPPEVTSSLESDVRETIPETMQEEISAPEETSAETEHVTEKTDSSNNAFSGTLWAGTEENGSVRGMIFNSETLTVLSTDADGALVRTEYEWSADTGYLYLIKDGAVASVNGWTRSEDNTQLILTNRENDTVITFYAVDGTSEEEVIAVMDALVLMQ